LPHMAIGSHLGYDDGYVLRDLDMCRIRRRGALTCR